MKFRSHHIMPFHRLAVALAMSDEMRDMFYIPISFVSITMLICIFVTLVLATIQLGLGSLILLARKKQLEQRETARRVRYESKVWSRASASERDLIKMANELSA